MVGSAIGRILSQDKKINLITLEKKDLDLMDQNKVNKFFSKNKIDEVYLAAAKVGGIFANNSYPANFIYENLTIQTNIIHYSFMHGVKKLLFLGSSCVYPRLAPQPIKEEHLLTSEFEPTNEPYAIAKVAGIKMCESYNRQYSKTHKIDYRCIMPSNLYGIGDNYHHENSHVVPALIRKFHEAKIEKKHAVTLWGTGNPKREFLFVDDLAEAAVFLMNINKEVLINNNNSSNCHLNVGSGEEFSISEIANLIKKVVGYNGTIIYDKSKPDGVPAKLLDSSKIRLLGWTPKTNLFDGLTSSYNDFLRNTSGVSNG